MATEVKISSITHNFIFKAFYLRGGLENKISWVAIWQNSNNMKMHRIEQCLLRLTEHLQKTISRREHRYIKAGVSVTSHVSNGTAQLTIHKMKTIIKKKKKCIATGGDWKKLFYLLHPMVLLCSLHPLYFYGNKWDTASFFFFIMTVYIVFIYSFINFVRIRENKNLLLPS